MNIETLNHLEDFSKNILVVIFAVFAFSSGPLLETNYTSVKILYTASLISAITSLHFGFNAQIKKANYLLKKSNSNPKIEPTVLKVKKHLEYQYYAALISLILLTSTIILHFFQNNYTPIKIIT